MNKDDQVLLKDPELSLAESLDNSIKNIVGIKDNMSDLKEIMENNANETPNVNITTDSKDTATSSVSNKVENSKGDLVTDSGIFSNTISKTGNPIKIPGKRITGTISKDRITGQCIFIQPGGGPGVPLRLVANSGNTAKQVAVQAVGNSDGIFVPIKPIEHIHLNDENLAGKTIISAINGQTVLLNKGANIANSTNTSLTSLRTASTSPSSARSLQNKPIMRMVTISGDKTKYLNSSSIVNIGNKIVVKGDNKRPLDDSSSSLQKLSSQKFIKLLQSATESGKVQTLQLLEPSGVKYLRLLKGVGKETLSPTKLILGNQYGYYQMVTKVNRQPLLDCKTVKIKDSSNEIVLFLGRQKHITMPMLRNIIDSFLIWITKYKKITVRKEELEQLNAKLRQKNLASTTSVTLGANIAPKPRILNNLGRLTDNLSISSSSNSLSNPQHGQQFLTKKNQIITGSSSLINLNKETVSNIKISPKKFFRIGGSLYSVSKPSIELIKQRDLNVSTTNTVTLKLSLRHCHCTKSQCLKLYCDCFATGDFCQDFNCKECFNNLEYEDERQNPIRMCLERNPAAFKPKITKARDQNDLRLHNKGCNCKRSGCLKNYCECYEAKIVCSSNCKCVGCRNIEDRGSNLNITVMSKIPKSYNRGISIKRSFDDIGGHSSGKIQNSNIKNEIDGDDEDSVLNILPKPRILNNLGRLTGNLSISCSSNSLSDPQHRQQFLTKKDQITARTSSLTTLNKGTVSNIKISPKKFVQIGGSQTVVRNFEAPQKLYSVLKPSSQVTEQKVPNGSTTNTATKLSSSLRKSFSGQRTRSSSPNTDGGLRRKHCNCTKSQCLKQYCDCFANGEFCQDCNCKECFNNLEYEDERQKAIRMCLERNPAAFKPKITKARDQNDLRLHKKGCNCKRSGCLKNYCECYEAKIVCSSNCKCVGCRNIEDRGPNLNITDMSKIPKSYNRGISIKRSFDDIGGHSSGKIQNSKIKNEIDGDDEDSVANDVNVSSLNQSGQSKPAYNFITQDIVDATVQCMIADTDKCQKGALPTKITERMILEKFGGCLSDIIDLSIKYLD